MKNLVIGAIDNYSVNKIYSWVTTLRNVYDGEIILMGYRVGDDIIEFCEKHRVTLFVAESDSFGQKIRYDINIRGTPSHYLRFYHMWELLNSLNKNEYKFVVSTDVRDVVFQRNPFEYLEQIDSSNFLIASSEDISVENEMWNYNNIKDGYGLHITAKFFEGTVYNVGVLAGTFSEMKKLFLMIYSMSGNRDLADQSSYILLVNELLNDKFIIRTMNEPWAAQCGTSLDKEKQYLWNNLLSNRPIIKDGLVYTFDENLFHIVHQWDRVSELKNIYVQ